MGEDAAVAVALLVVRDHVDPQLVVVLGGARVAPIRVAELPGNAWLEGTKKERDCYIKSDFREQRTNTGSVFRSVARFCHLFPFMFLPTMGPDGSGTRGYNSCEKLVLLF